MKFFARTRESDMGLCLVGPCLAGGVVWSLSPQEQDFRSRTGGGDPIELEKLVYIGGLWAGGGGRDGI